MSQHLRCQVCGGSVVFDIAVEGAACLFCGSVALTAAPPEEHVPEPDAMLVAKVDRSHADTSYRAWSRKSWFTPKALRSLTVELRPMLLPAWRFAGEIETHWAGLAHAGTRSGKAPVSGHETIALRYMIPASGGLSESELTGLQPFDENAAQPWDPAAEHIPWEPPALSEESARIRAHQVMAQHHAHELSRQHSLTRCNVSPVVHDRDVDLFMVPIYIGAFMFRDQPWRFVVNAQTGEVVGEAPIDRVKVALLIAGGVALLVAIAIIVLFGNVQP